MFSDMGFETENEIEMVTSFTMVAGSSAPYPVVVSPCWRSQKKASQGTS